MRFECSGKVFIVGEYACIEGGPAILLTPGPRFALTVDVEPKGAPLPFAAGSPAGLFLAKHSDVLKDVKLTWHDPYKTPIGVGSSSAQFILSVAAVASLRKEPRPSAREVLHLYWDIVGDTQGLRPSGVDVIAQWTGGPLLARNEPFQAEKLPSWTEDARFVLAFTGSKAKTHEHLAELQRKGFPKAYASALDRLAALTMTGAALWKARDAAGLGRLLNSYQDALTEGGLAPEEFSARLRELRELPGVLGCKGSGAQGGDCVLLLVEQARREQAFKALRALGWDPLAPDWDGKGLTVGHQNG